MFQLLAEFPEYIACTAVLIAVVGYAWLTIELSGEAVPASAEGSRDGPGLR